MNGGSRLKDGNGETEFKGYNILNGRHPLIEIRIHWSLPLHQNEKDQIIIAIRIYTISTHSRTPPEQHYSLAEAPYAQHT